MIKKLAAVTAALTIAICSFTSCSKNNDSSSTVSSTVDSSVSAVDSTTEKQHTYKCALIPMASPLILRTLSFAPLTARILILILSDIYYYYTISKYTSTYGATLTYPSQQTLITALVAPELYKKTELSLQTQDN